MLNFVPDCAAMVRELVPVTRLQGGVAAYVWGCAGGMQMTRHFWDVAKEVNPADPSSIKPSASRSASRSPARYCSQTPG